MSKKEEFSKTISVASDISEKFRQMERLASIKLGLGLNIPFDPANEDLRGAPTKLVNGTLYIDTEALLKMLDEAYDARDANRMLPVLGLREALQNVLNAESPAQGHDTVRVSEDDAERVRRALAAPGTTLIPRKNPNLAETLEIKKPSNGT